MEHYRNDIKDAMDDSELPYVYDKELWDEIEYTMKKEEDMERSFNDGVKQERLESEKRLQEERQRYDTECCFCRRIYVRTSHGGILCFKELRCKTFNCIA